MHRMNGPKLFASNHNDKSSVDRSGDDPRGDGDLPSWFGVTCSTVSDYRVVTVMEKSMKKAR